MGQKKADTVCLIKFVEIPVWSGVFLSFNSFVASRISFFVNTLLCSVVCTSSIEY